MLPWQPFLAFYTWGAHWRCLKNTTEPSMCGGDAALCQITLTTCYNRLCLLIFQSVEMLFPLMNLNHRPRAEGSKYRRPITASAHANVGLRPWGEMEILFEAKKNIIKRYNSVPFPIIFVCKTGNWTATRNHPECTKTHHIETRNQIFFLRRGTPPVESLCLQTN